MGGTKRYLEDVEERGWHSSDKAVCADCIDDVYLKKIVGENLNAENCDYCQSYASEGIAAPLDELMPFIATALRCYFSPLDTSGAPIGAGGFGVTGYCIEEALGALPLYCEQELFDDIANTFIDDLWVESAGGHWASLHVGDVVTNGWREFKHEVMFQTRYFFSSPRESDGLNDQENLSPTETLAIIGSYAESFGLIKELDAGAKFYRARPGLGHHNYVDIGPPQLGKAGNGRMNPAGISYFYLADNPNTAIAEVGFADKAQASLATFELLKRLKIIDFSVLPDTPSVFKPGVYNVLEAVKFWHEFELEIRQPISEDDQISYIPSQVLSEYFAKIFRCKDGASIDGFYYESATSSPGKNLVIFPEATNKDGWEGIAKLNSASDIRVESAVNGYIAVRGPLAGFTT